MAIKQQHQRKNQKGRGGDRKTNEVAEKSASLNALPNTFKFAAEALQTMSEKGGSAGSIVVGKYKSYNYKLIFALVMNTVKNIKIIKKIIHETKLMKKVNESNPFMLEILVGDLLFGKGLKSVEQNTTAASIINLKDTILKQQKALKKEFGAHADEVSAKYIRINHLKSSKEHVMSQLKTIGLTQLDYSKDKIKFKKFINKFKTMTSSEFMVDFHFPDDLIVLKPEAADKIKKTDLLKKHKVVLQDKASFMATEAMDVMPSQKIIDACCAPGCKTALIADKMRNKGKILGYDSDKKRLINAIHLLKTHGVTCAKLEVQDFSKVKLRRLLKTANKEEKFDCILLDPSCSGSGIQSRVDYKKTDEEIGRLKKLQAFQVSLLKHALKSCVSKTIVYCTCSSSVEENEQVVQMALKESGVSDRWQVVDVLPYWQQRGNESYDFGAKCLRSDPTNLTNGFFIAKMQLNLNFKASASKNAPTDDDDVDVDMAEKATHKNGKDTKAKTPIVKAIETEGSDEEEVSMDSEDEVGSDEESVYEDADSMEDEEEPATDETEEDDNDDGEDE